MGWKFKGICPFKSFLKCVILIHSLLYFENASSYQLCLNTWVKHKMSPLGGFHPQIRENHSYITIENDDAQTVYRAGFWNKLTVNHHKWEKPQGVPSKSELSTDLTFYTKDWSDTFTVDGTTPEGKRKIKEAAGSMIKNATVAITGRLFTEPDETEFYYYGEAVDAKICQDISKDIIPFIESEVNLYEAKFGAYDRHRNNCTRFAKYIYETFTGDTFLLPFKSPIFLQNMIFKAQDKGLNHLNPITNMKQRFQNLKSHFSQSCDDKTNESLGGEVSHISAILNKIMGK